MSIIQKEIKAVKYYKIIEFKIEHCAFISTNYFLYIYIYTLSKSLYFFYK